MLPEKYSQILSHEGVVAIATMGADGPHLINTWNSYVQVRDDKLLIPVGMMQQTEKNLAADDRILLTAGTREVEGSRGAGAGFLIKGTGAFHTSGEAFDTVHSKFPWARAALVVTVQSHAQTL
ncbi:MAG: pyridoxamine 5'-phosphate oxidase family protein [Candidatus Hydrogenedentales bacterium]